MLMEGYWKRLAKPFQSRRGRSILEGNYDHGVADDDAADYSSTGGGAVLGEKRRAEKQRNHKDENSGAFHDKLIISAERRRITRAVASREQNAQWFRPRRVRAAT